MKNKFTFLLCFLILFVPGKLFSQNSSGVTWLKINEVDYDQAGTDTSEFIELFNTSSSAGDLGSVWVYLFNGNGNTVYDSFPLPSQMLNASAYFVICGNAGVVPNCNMVLPAASNIIQNGSPDAIMLLDTATSSVLDAVSYEGSCPTPYVEGTGVPPSQSDSIFNYTSVGRYPDGTDTDNNSTDFQLQCITPGTANTNVNTNCQAPVSAGNEIKITTRLRVYPNPATEKIFVLGIPVSPSPQVAFVYDAAGKICLQQPVPAGSKGIAISVGSLHNGIFSLVLSSENFTERKTFIVAR